MSSTVFVTGGTGQTGANVCQQLIERGDEVVALVRKPEEAAALAAIGVELRGHEARGVPGGPPPGRGG
jgi:dihydroflavonol-4-reductase